MDDSDSDEVDESLAKLRDTVEILRHRLNLDDGTCENLPDDSTSSSTSASEDEVRSLRVQVTELRKQLKDALGRCAVTEKENVELRNRLHVETITRRSILDELLTVKGNIRVFVRIKPAKREREAIKHTLQVVDDRSVKVYPYDKQFEFDALLSERFSNENLFAAHVEPMLRHVLDGTSCTLIAYGQTGSGKTHTMLGEADDLGLVHRSVKLAFNVAMLSSDFPLEFSISALEVYNDHVYDLLSEERGKSLEVRTHSEDKANISVKGLSRVALKSMEESMTILQRVSRRRATATHSVNDRSSRSHLVVMLHVGDRSSFVFVDLAGSERLSRTEASGDRLKESQHINKSLSALGDVLQALGDRSTKHVPFRNSKLTFLLQDVLSGKSKVAVVACISSEAESSSETFSTLNFVERMRKVELAMTRGVSNPAPRLT